MENNADKGTFLSNVYRYTNHLDSSIISNEFTLQEE